MRKILAAVLTLTMLMGLVACGSNEDPNAGKTVIDVFSAVTVTFGSDSVRSYCLNGSGHLYVSDIDFDLDALDYDKSNSDIKKFLKDIDFEWVEYDEKATKLRNGDVVTIRLEYSKSTAEALGIVLREETKQYVVSGLKEVYRTTEELTGEAVLALAQMCEDMAYESKIAWYTSEEGREYYSNFLCDTDVQAYLEYGPDGNGEEYIMFAVFLVTYSWSADYVDGDYEEYVEQEDWAVFSVQLDQSDDEYTVDINDDTRKRISWGWFDEWSISEGDTVVAYKLNADGTISLDPEGRETHRLEAFAQYSFDD